MKKVSPVEKMLVLSVSFTMLLLFVRIFYTKELMYGFYIWNTFLAIVPLLFSRSLSSMGRVSPKSILLLAGWLVFFPNAPYLVTDLFHFTDLPPVPQWFDLLLVSSAAWNGLLLGIVSLMHVEQFLAIHFKKPVVGVCVLICILLCGYGVYIGRYLRFNSWDIIADPRDLLFASARHVLRPTAHMGAWAFTVLFSSMFGIVYYTLKLLENSFARTNK